ncbi:MULTISPECIES: carbohydrate ABC transporter permease [Brevibacterium]|uniref:Carbohydrate ABC transporter permease n=1 Tax=Brevibacterium casei TaxID=33889 RepID=A0A7T4A0P3_9MICO|nr:carbohydrate ABC transporter permease [Brevibacterium casei]QQB15117.1 carbohydrate ABC transporter permease [Brevibacterium casei]
MRTQKTVAEAGPETPVRDGGAASGSGSSGTGATTSASRQDLPPRTRDRATWGQAFAPRNLADTILTGYLPLLIAIALIVLPLAWMVIASFKPPGEIITLTPTLLPQEPTLGNYEAVADRVPLGRILLNSVIVTTVGSVIKVVLAITSAYALVFIRVRFKNVIFLGILVALMVPPEVALLPNYLTISALGGRDTLWGILLPGLGTAFGTFLLRQQFKTLPVDMLEAAELDGAGHWKRLWRIVVPVSAPAIATVALVTIVTEWNSFMWPLVITDTPENMTLPVGLNLLQSVEGQTGSYGYLMAGAVLVIVPVLIVFAALQRHIVSGLTQGAVK